MKATTHPCHRCLQPVLPNAKRCPHCGEPQPVGAYGKIALAALGATVLVAVLVFIVLRVVEQYQSP